MKEVNFGAQPCPHGCAHTIEGRYYCPEVGPQIKAGDLSFCPGCGGITVFDATMRQRVITEAERQDLERTQSEFWEAMQLVASEIKVRHTVGMN
jgi:hypothetical protein